MACWIMVIVFAFTNGIRPWRYVIFWKRDLLILPVCFVVTENFLCRLMLQKKKLRTEEEKVMYEHHLGLAVTHYKHKNRCRYALYMYWRWRNSSKKTWGRDMYTKCCSHLHKNNDGCRPQWSYKCIFSNKIKKSEKIVKIQCMHLTSISTFNALLILTAN